MTQHTPSTTQPSQGGRKVSLPFISSTSPYLQKPSRIPRRTTSGTIVLSASKPKLNGRLPSYSGPATSKIKTGADLASELRAKLHAISPRRQTDSSYTSRRASLALEPIIEDNSSNEGAEVSIVSIVTCDTPLFESVMEEYLSSEPVNGSKTTITAPPSTLLESIIGDYFSDERENAPEASPAARSSISPEPVLEDYFSTQGAAPNPTLPSALLDTIIGDYFPIEQGEPSVHTPSDFGEYEEDDSRSQFATVISTESPCPQSLFFVPRDATKTTSTITKPSSKPLQERKKLRKRPFRVDKLRLFLNKPRIGWRSTIPMPQMSPRIVILDILVQDKQMGLKFALKEEISALKAGEEEKEDTNTPMDSSIGDKLKRAKAMARDGSIDEGSKILVLEEVLEEVEGREGGLEDWLLDEIEDVSAIYGDLLGVDEVEIHTEAILAKERMRGQEMDDPGELWRFDEERICMGEKGFAWPRPGVEDD
ncbi:hypothetical protein TWF481_011393 [Arthrobotrys musiformis]|uniref:Uncharacterized protein n=1 Tax=Arthrobotrys musiformis TaxID=47236 RepID=A0AAV9W019_9PEZI